MNMLLNVLGFVLGVVAVISVVAMVILAAFVEGDI